ncbi:hypothetical protein I302_103186 [Kwoniella bestiolae CBS 10118]|uniref:Uncharacterized protein n=1 Tax=Kwoniella bestiolae CBS 10118 TaxID=1296100 RepID=A0A1B9G7P3_9TREE|nr:hypothetical protein I302_01884 [Kwoniella bestiolae CBS 10118]OCF27049.1 hypothetical protein I302_01884 [Kwoniella bestiolae CBS 10118]
MASPTFSNAPRIKKREFSSEPGPSRRPPESRDEDNWEDVDTSTHPPKTPEKISARSGRDSPAGSVASSPSRRVALLPRTSKSRTSTTPRRSTSSRSHPQPPRTHPQPAIPARQPIPVLDTLNILLLPFRLLLAPLHILLSPFLAHLANAFLLLTIGGLGAYFILPLIPSIILKLLGKAVRYISSDFLSRSLGFSISQDSDISLGKEVLLLPAKTLATPACLLTGLFCQTSLRSHHINGTTVPARPFWSSFRANDEEEEDPVDVGQYARALAQEARGARDIFDSVRMLGQGGVAGGLNYVKIWELAVTVNTGSTLEGKGIFAEQIKELGDMTRDLSDEIVHIDSKTVNAFSWLQWEFRDLVNLLSLPPSTRPTSSVLSRKLHSLLLRLSTELDSIYALTSTASQHASHASVHGQSLDSELSQRATGLRYEKDRSPGWKILYDKSSHFLVGGEPSKVELIERDLKITTKTIGDIRRLSRNLEETRTKVKVYRDQVGMFSASMMGFHLGSGEEVGLGPEEEVRVLNEVVEGLARAVGMAKQEQRGERRRVEVLEIDQ